jgi:hypothetical protein
MPEGLSFRLWNSAQPTRRAVDVNTPVTVRNRPDLRQALFAPLCDGRRSGCPELQQGLSSTPGYELPRSGSD